MIWLTLKSLRAHEWVEPLPLSCHTLVCTACGLTRPIRTDWLTYPHHCPPRLEAA